MPIIRVKSVKIYTSQKKFTRGYLWLPWQIWGMKWAALKNAPRLTAVKGKGKFYGLFLSLDYFEIQDSNSSFWDIIESRFKTFGNFFPGGRKGGRGAKDKSVLKHKTKFETLHFPVSLQHDSSEGPDWLPTLSFLFEVFFIWSRTAQSVF